MRSAIEQVMLDLVTNAVEAVGDRGTIHITTGTDAGSVTVAVQDDGTGMSEETIGRVFDPYFSTKFTGRGLGLAAADGVVQGSRRQDRHRVAARRRYDDDGHTARGDKPGLISRPSASARRAARCASVRPWRKNFS